MAYISVDEEGLFKYILPCKEEVDEIWWSRRSSKPMWALLALAGSIPAPSAKFKLYEYESDPFSFCLNITFQIFVMPLYQYRLGLENVYQRCHENSAD